MKLAKIFIASTFLLIFALCISAQKSDEPCSIKIDYVNRNQVDPPTISLRGVQGRAIGLDGGVVELEMCVALFTEKGHRFVAQTITDENGYFHFRKIAKGRYRLVGKDSYNGYCPVNVRVHLTSLSRRKRLVLHMLGGGIDTCSYGDTK